VRGGTRQLHHVPGQPGGLDRLSLQGRFPAGVEPRDPDAEIHVASGWIARLRHTGSLGSADERALGPVPMTARGKTPTFATIAVVLASFVRAKASPPVPLSATRRGGTAESSASPEGREGQGVRTGGNQGASIP